MAAEKESSAPAGALVDSDYDSEEDSDFDPTSAPVHGDDDNLDSSSDEDEAGDDNASKPKKRKRTFSITSADGYESLIKTRSQRAAETREKAGGVSQGKVTTDVDKLWEQMNAAPISKPATAAVPEKSTEAAEKKKEEKQDTNATGEKMITIKHTYEFAGKTITEEKLVPENSETAKAYLSSMAAAKAPAPTPEGMPARRPPPKKRASAFDAAAASKSKIAPVAKINTLEKSRLDWAGFVDKEGIGDELKQFNKGDKGYLDRQAFLGRVEENRDRQWKEAKKKG
jgi:hypothetical protein